MHWGGLYTPFHGAWDLHAFLCNHTGQVTIGGSKRLNGCLSGSNLVHRMLRHYHECHGSHFKHVQRVTQEAGCQNEAQVLLWEQKGCTMFSQRSLCNKYKPYPSQWVMLVTGDHGNHCGNNFVQPYSDHWCNPDFSNFVDLATHAQCSIFIYMCPQASIN